MATTTETVAVRITGDAREFRRTVRATEQAARRLGRDAARAMDPYDRAIKRTTADLTQMQAAARKAAAQASIAARQARSQIVAGYSRMKSAISTAVGFGGVAGAVMGIRDAQRFEQALVQLQVQGKKTAAWLDQARKKIIEISDDTGRAKEEVLAYLQGIVEATGDADFAIDSLKQMGEVAVATGANMGDLAGAMEKAAGSFRLAAKDSMALWNIWRQQEKLGSVTVADISREIGKAAGLASGFGKAGLGLSGARAIGGLMQIAARGFGKDQKGEAATATMRFLSQLQTKVAKDPVKAARMLGLRVSDLGRRTKEGFEFNDLTQVFRAIGEAAARDPNRAAKYADTLFGRIGRRVYMQLRNAAAVGWGQASGPYAAAQAIFGVSGTHPIIASDAAIQRGSKAFKLAQQLNKLRNRFYEAFIPVMEKLADILPSISRGLVWTMRHIKDLVTIWLGTKLVKAIRLIGGAIGGVGAGGVGAGGRIGVGGFLSRAGGYAGMALMAAEAGKMLGEYLAGHTIAEMRAEIAALHAEIERGRQNRRAAYAKRNIAADWAANPTYSTAEGAEAWSRARRLLRDLGADRGHIAVDALIEQRGIKGAKGLRDRLKGQYQTLYAATEAEIRRRLPKEYRDLKIDRGTVEGAMPILASMRGSYEKLDQRLAQLVQLASSGKKVPLQVNVTVKIADPTAPGARVTRRKPTHTVEIFNPKRFKNDLATVLTGNFMVADIGSAIGLW